MIAKVHILEGRDVGGVRVMTCGHRDTDYGWPAIGCARLKEEGSKVTCKRCRAIYQRRNATLLPGDGEVKS